MIGRHAAAFEVLEESIGAGDLDRGQPSRSFWRRRNSRWSRVGPPPPSPRPKGTSRRGDAVLLHALVPALDHVPGCVLGVVVVVEVRQDAGAVDAFPQKVL